MIIKSRRYVMSLYYSQQKINKFHWTKNESFISTAVHLLCELPKSIQNRRNKTPKPVDCRDENEEVKKNPFDNLMLISKKENMVEKG